MDKIIDGLRVKVALDTQILAYLVDKTYPSLNQFIGLLAENPFVDIVCPRFAIYEFIGIRKLEHYLRCLVKEAGKKSGTLNFSSAIKYKSEFESPELRYIDAYADVKSEVENELKLIYDDFGITYESVTIHNDLWKPHQDLVLSTRISKEDSLLLLSSVFPDSITKEPHLILLTNDNQFTTAFKDAEFQQLQNDIFSNDGLTKPILHNLKSCELVRGKTINLTLPLEEDLVTTFAKEFVLEQIIAKNQTLFLGKTINCACNEELKKQLICFQLEDEKELVENLYLSILTTDYTVYNHPIKLSSFFSHGKIELPYIGGDTAESKEISVKLTDEDGSNIDAVLMASISSPGNLVFIHPDTFI
ncbi:MAG TPA: hypothetical protein VF676_12720 [Flavobacterium sp.]|jgi:hypothetical protein